MNIVVLVKQVPETDALTLDLETGTVKRSPAASIVNPLDLYALEAALRLKDKDPGIRISVLSMGPPSAEVACREALSMGCDEACLLTGAGFAGADTWATARCLASAVQKLGPFDLVLAGEKATDGDTGQVGPEVAAFLGYPVVTYASSLELQSGDRACWIRAGRITEESTQVVDCPLPAVLTFCKALGEARLPLLSGKKKAHGALVRKLGPADLGLSSAEIGTKGSPTKVSKIASPEIARKARHIDAREELGLEAAVEAVLGLLGRK